MKNKNGQMISHVRRLGQRRICYNLLIFGGVFKFIRKCECDIPSRDLSYFTLSSSEIIKMPLRCHVGLLPGP